MKTNIEKGMKLIRARLLVQEYDVIFLQGYCKNWPKPNNSELD